MPALTAVGSARCSRGGGTTFTFTFGSSARPTTRNANRSRRGRWTTAAARSSRIGSLTPCSTRGPRRRRSPSRGRRWPTCRPPAAKFFWRRSCRRPRSRPRRGFESPFRRGHVEVAVFVVKNNRKQGDGAARGPLQPSVASSLPPGGRFGASFHCLPRKPRGAHNKNPERRAARAGWRIFGEYIFLEDSRYASQRENARGKPICPPCALRCRTGRPGICCLG